MELDNEVIGRWSVADHVVTVEQMPDNHLYTVSVYVQFGEDHTPERFWGIDYDVGQACRALEGKLDAIACVLLALGHYEEKRATRRLCYDLHLFAYNVGRPLQGMSVPSYVERKRFEPVEEGAHGDRNDR